MSIRELVLYFGLLLVVVGFVLVVVYPLFATYVVWKKERRLVFFAYEPEDQDESDIVNSYVGKCKKARNVAVACAILLSIIVIFV